MSCSRTFANRRAVEQALAEAGFETPIASSRDLSGGCIHRVRELTLADGTRLVAKTNLAQCLGLFQEEADGLAALAATGTVLTPRPLGLGCASGAAVLLMEALAPAEATQATWRTFGRELAALHRAPIAGAPRGYGFHGDNHLGATAQPNGWCDDWVEFNGEHRLGHQLRLAAAGNLLRPDEAALVRGVIEHLERFLPRRPRPSLLHGDLWSGNALPARTAGTARIGVIDPACSIGDGWADIAMMRLFGGFPEGCFEAYAAAVDDHDDLDARIAVYQLYHVLNHVNLFGRGYAQQAMSLARKLTV